jgi:hypothetical protein
MPHTRPVAIRLVSWNDSTARARALELTELGFSVDASSLLGRGGVIGHFRDAAPDAVVLDLDRLPSHGREVGVMLRSSKSTRHLPLVFAGGDPEKVERIRAELPDAVFTSWDKIADAVRHAMAHPLAVPIKPTPHMERWGAAGLSRKLDIKAGTQVALLGGLDGFPGGLEGFTELLGDLPEGSVLVKRFTPETRLALYFVHSARELTNAFEHAVARLPKDASLWIIHPKQTKTLRTDFNQNDVREFGLACGFVDYKVCAVNSEWSGLKFARRKK